MKIDQFSPFVSPLNLYVVWHPAFNSNARESKLYGGKEYANFIYRRFCRDGTTAYDRGIGIPTFFRFEGASSKQPIEIPIHEADRNVVVVLTESNLVNDPLYKNYVQTIAGSSGDLNRVFFFCMDRFGYGVDPSQDRRLYTSIYQTRHTNQTSEFELRCGQIEAFLMNDLCRVLLDHVPSYQIDKQKQSRGNAPLRLVLSYSRNDGYEQAKNLRMHVEGHMKLQAFVEVHDLETTGSWRNELLDQFDMNTALVVLNTDEYSHSERWKDEVRKAKERAASMVLVNDRLVAEKRTFPYLGNVPAIPWKHNPDDIINAAVSEILQRRFAKMLMDNIKETYAIDDRKYIFFSLGCPPELFHISSIKKLVTDRQNVLVLYPDPPLGKIEHDILVAAQAHWTWVTPTTINSLNL